MSWLIDEIHMNICEDYKFFLLKKLMSKDYPKDYQKMYFNRQQVQPTNYSGMTKEEVTKLIQDNIMADFKSWV